MPGFIAHPDSKHKIITVLLGFSWEWPYEKGKLRILNSPDREDYTFELRGILETRNRHAETD